MVKAPRARRCCSAKRRAASVSSSPIGLAGGMNLYGFANGDPVNFSDPFGLFPLALVVPAGAFIASPAGQRVLERAAVLGAAGVAVAGTYAALKWTDVKTRLRQWAGVGSIAVGGLLGGQDAAEAAAKAAAQREKARIEAVERRRKAEEERRSKKKESDGDGGNPPDKAS